MANGDQPKAAGDKSKKRKQRYLPQNKPVKKKGSYPLKPGVQGFFITCDGGRERQAAHEALNVVDSFFEELIYGSDPAVKPSGLPEKPLNKKITFSYSDEEDDDDEDDREEEEGKNGGEEGKEKSKSNANSAIEEKIVGKKSCEGKDTKENSNKEDGGGMQKSEDQEAPTKNACLETNASEKAEPEKVEEKSESNINGVSEEKLVGEKSCVEKGMEEKSNKGDCWETQKNEDQEPPAKKPCLETNVSEKAKPEKVEENSIDRLIDAELQELGDKSKRRFMKLDSGCNGLAFIQMRRRQGDPSPKEIVQHMMTTTAATRKHMSRYILRVLPIEVACYTSEDEISRAITPLVEQYFPVETDCPRKFAVLYEARANTGIDRMKIINTVAKSVPAPHKVDLSHPEITIIVQIVKTVCLIGVVEKYKELAKYNLRQLTSTK